MSTPSSPLGSHDFDDVVEKDLSTTISAFEGDFDQLDPDLAIRIARVWRETLQQSDWPNANSLADQWERLEDALTQEDAEDDVLADILLDLGEGHRVLAGEIGDDRLAPDLEHLGTAITTAGERLGGTEVQAHSPRVDGGRD